LEITEFITWFPNAFFLVLYKTCKFYSCLIELDILEKKSGFKQHQPSSKYTIIPDRKMAHFKEKLNYVLKNPDRIIAKKLASIIGQIISMSFVLGNVCQIMTRILHLHEQLRFFVL
jgi:hypothetical protein